MDAAYFDAMYADKRDPWDFESSLYEAAKYQDTIDSLGTKHYNLALEVGCSIGVLTQKLAQICDKLVATEISSYAIAQAKNRCAALPHVQFLESTLPQQAPQGIFDLVVLSEVCYYWNAHDLQIAKDALLSVCAPNAQIILVHWTPFVESYPQTADAVHTAFLSDPRLLALHAHRTDRYRLDLLCAVP